MSIVGKGTLTERSVEEHKVAHFRKVHRKTKEKKTRTADAIQRPESGPQSHTTETWKLGNPTGSHLSADDIANLGDSSHIVLSAKFK